MTVAELEVVLSGKIDKLERAMSQGKKEVEGFANSAKESAQKASNSFKESFSQIIQGVQSLGTQLTVGVTLPIVALGKTTLDAATQMESLKATLSTVMGSAGASADEFRKLNTAARLPGIDLRQAVQGSANLQAMGISADKARFMLAQYANAIAKSGGGREQFERTVVNLTQIGSAAKLAGDELREMSENVGPEFRQALAKAFGTMDPQKIAKLGISGKEAIMRVAEELSQTARANQNTMRNHLENFEMDIFQFKADVGAALIPIAKDLLPKITDAIKKAVDWFKKLTPEMREMVIKSAALAAALGPALVVFASLANAIKVVVGIGSSLGSMFAEAGGAAGLLEGALAALTGPIALVIAAAGLIYEAWANNWGNIRHIIMSFVHDFEKWWKSIAPVVQEVINEFVYYFKAGWQIISFTVSKTLGVMLDAIGLNVKSAKEIWDTFFGGMTVMLALLSGDFDKAMNSMGRYAQLAALKFEEVWMRGIAFVAGKFADFVDGVRAAMSALHTLNPLVPGGENVPNPFRNTQKGLESGADTVKAIYDNGVRGEITSDGVKFAPADPWKQKGLSLQNASPVDDAKKKGKLLQDWWEQWMMDLKEAGRRTVEDMLGIFNSAMDRIREIKLRAKDPIGADIADVLGMQMVQFQKLDEVLPTHANELRKIGFEMVRNKQLVDAQNESGAMAINFWRSLTQKLIDQKTAAEKLRASWEKVWYWMSEVSRKNKEMALDSAVKATAEIEADDLKKRLEKERLALEEHRQRIQDIAQSIASGISDTLMSAFGNLSHGFKGFMDSIIQGISSMLADLGRQFIQSQITKWILQLVGGAMGGGGGKGGSWSWLSNMRAVGGPVLAGRPYMVGENGPELFVPNSNGSIKQSSVSGQAGGVNITMHVHTKDAQSFKESESQIMARLGAASMRAIRRNG
jgi:tape measure domain-containing protein